MSPLGTSPPSGRLAMLPGLGVQHQLSMSDCSWPSLWLEQQLPGCSGCADGRAAVSHWGEGSVAPLVWTEHVSISAGAALLPFLPFF